MNQADLYRYIGELSTKYEDRHPFTMSVLREMHRLTVKDIYPCAGNLRHSATDQVKINADFVPAEPYEVRIRVPDLMSVASKWRETVEGMQIDPSKWVVWKDTRRVCVATDLFYEFVIIHPFRGGNGRVGRAFLNLLLYEMGILTPPEQIFSFMGSRRKAYMDALRRADTGDFTDLHDYVIRAVLDTMTEPLYESLLKNEAVTKRLSRDLRHFMEIDKRNLLSNVSYQKRLAKLLPELRRISARIESVG